MNTKRDSEPRELLAARDVTGLIAWAGSTRGALSRLLSLTFDTDALIRWRAVEAIGRTAGMLAGDDVERVRGLIRRLLWLTNDESGAVGWHAPETIGEILVNVPSLIGEYGVLLTGFYRRAPFERGSHLAVYRVACVDRAPFVQSAPELADSLGSPDAFVRGHAALALAAIGVPSHRPAIETLREDPAPVRSYDFDTGLLQATTVGRMAERAVELLDATTEA